MMIIANTIAQLDKQSNKTTVVSLKNKGRE